MSARGDGRVFVLTGSTRGIGRGLAGCLLERGCKVVLSGRDPAQLDAVRDELAARFGAERVHGARCDVGDAASVRALWSAAVERFGRVDVWVNNAGTSNPQRAFSEQRDGTIASVVSANVLGTMYGTRVALEGLRAQPGGGAIYNVEGYGSDGASRRGMALYGATKRAVRYFTRAVAAEERGGPVRVGRISPGIVSTDLLVDVYADGDPALWERSRWLFKFIADPVEVVTPWLADALLRDRGHDSFLAYMTVPKAALRVFNPYYWRRDLFSARRRELPREGPRASG